MLLFDYTYSISAKGARLPDGQAGTARDPCPTDGRRAPLAGDTSFIKNIRHLLS